LFRPLIIVLNFEIMAQAMLEKKRDKKYGIKFLWWKAV